MRPCSVFRNQKSDYFECEWDRRHLVLRLVLYFCIVLSLETREQRVEERWHVLLVVQRVCVLPGVHVVWHMLFR